MIKECVCIELCDPIYDVVVGNDKHKLVNVLNERITEFNQTEFDECGEGGIVIPLVNADMSDDEIDEIVPDWGIDKSTLIDFSRVDPSDTKCLMVIEFYVGDFEEVQAIMYPFSKDGVQMIVDEFCIIGLEEESFGDVLSCRIDPFNNSGAGVFCIANIR